MRSPLVSVVIPSYNHEQYIQQCIQSVIEQSYKNIELVIIDDGSTDQSIEKIKQLCEVCRERFTDFKFHSRANRGLCETLNEALNRCNGEYVCIIASDDLMKQNKIMLQIEYANQYPEVCSIYGGVSLIDELGKEIETIDLALVFYDFEQIFMHKSTLYAPTQMHKLKDLKEVGGFDSSVKIEDWDLLLKLSSLNKLILCIPEQLSYYRIHDLNTSKDQAFMVNELLKIANKYSEHKLYRQAKFRIIKQYQLNPLKRISKTQYYFKRLLTYISI